MELIWDSLETVTIPNVGTVRKGVKFGIEDNQGLDLIARGLASRPLPPKKVVVGVKVMKDLQEAKALDADLREKE